MNNESILITGGTGTFGRAFVSYLLQQTNIPRICIYSRGEHAQADMRAQLNDDPRLRWFIGDVRDEARLRRAMSGVDKVVHAAALKRIEVGAYNPDEMVKTNVLGTMNVIEAAISSGVRRVIGLSSDKAYQPISPYGQSKALGESLLLAANEMHGWQPDDGRTRYKEPKKKTQFIAVRYGNIWNAQGSIVPKWIGRWSQGKPITITDPECTRFYMTVDQAVELVWQCVQGQFRNLVIPTNLPAYRVGDLAEAFCAEFICESETVGLPGHEKLHESMDDGLCSLDARRMTIDELRGLLRNV